MSVVAENRHVRFAWRGIVISPKEAAERRLNAEDGEVAARHQHSLGVERLAVVREVGIKHTMRGDAGEHRLHALEVSEHRMAEDDVAIARDVT